MQVLWFARYFTSHGYCERNNMKQDVGKTSHFVRFYISTMLSWIRQALRGNLSKKIMADQLQDMNMQGPVFRNLGRGWLIPLLIVVINVSGCEKVRLDEEVRRLCAIDGGVKVYETVILPAERFDKYGVVHIPLKEMATPKDDYFYEQKVTYLARGNPELWRTHFRIVRRTDGMVLGESISYTRRGGDIPGPWQASSLVCPNPVNRKSVEQLVFKNEAQK